MPSEIVSRYLARHVLAAASWPFAAEPVLAIGPRHLAHHSSSPACLEQPRSACTGGWWRAAVDENFRSGMGARVLAASRRQALTALDMHRETDRERERERERMRERWGAFR